ncbi:MAG: DUF1320 family protein [Flavobacteriales bacterium]|nr:DUF1320 family protein [Flavobacteriales bacterium]
MAIEYAFLTAADVNSRIRDEHRNDLRDWDPGAPEPDENDAEAVAANAAALATSETVELSCESMAIAKVRSALHNRFNDDALFAAEDDDRHPLVILHVLNIFVYLLYRRINPRKIPETVKDDHDETLAWLDRVAAGKEVPDFPAVEDPSLDAGIPRVGGAWIPKGHHF